MFSTHDGAHTALTGFTLQVVVAVLEGLAREDWQSLFVEPLEEGREYEKVDLCWHIADGSQEHVQVKHSKNPFSRPDIERWASEVAKQRGQRHRLVLLGVPSTTAHRATMPPSISVEFSSNDLNVGYDAIAQRIAEFCERRDTIIRPSSSREAAECIVGLMLTGATLRREWTPQSLRCQVFQQCRPFAESQRLSASGLNISLTRFVMINEDRSVDEYLVHEVRDPGNAGLPKAYRFKFTDHDKCTVLEVTDGGRGDEDPYWAGSDDEPSTFWLGIRPADVLHPPGVLTVGAWVRRTGVVEDLGNGLLVFRCPLLPTADPQRALVVAVFPEGGSIEADGAWRATTRVACWKTTTSSSPRSITAVFRPRHVESELASIDGKLATLYMERAKAGIVRPLPRSKLRSIESNISQGFRERAEYLKAE